LKYIVSTSGVSSSVPVEGSCSVSPSEVDSESSDSEPVIWNIEYITLPFLISSLFF